LGRRLADEWESLLKTVRATPGFEGFLQPRPYSELAKAAQSGPVVVLNVSKLRCDAFVVSQSEPLLHIPLKCFSYTRADELQRLITELLSNARVHVREAERSVRPHKAANSSGPGFRKLLAELWNTIVKQLKDHLPLRVWNEWDHTINEALTLPHIWWCPTGPLTFLPIHTAGIYDATGAEPTESLADLVVSLYTPTLTALLLASTRIPSQQCKPFQLLAISQPSTPGAPLPHAVQELQLIQDHILL